MDFFDERVLAALKDGKPRGFTTLLGEVGFSHNTLRQHLERLAAQGFVVKEKVAATVSEDPYGELVALSFSRLKHLCRFEKGGYCKETKKSCGPQICPQTRKQEL